MVSNIKNIVTVLRKNESIQFIGKVCPTLVETRWIYLYDILEFIELYKNDILTIFMELETNFSICSVGKYIKELLSYLKIDEFKLIDDVFKDLYIILISRIKSNNFDLVITAYFLSSEGRSHFRKQNNSSVDMFVEEETHYNYPPLQYFPVVLTKDPIKTDNVHQFLEKAINKSESEILSTSLLESDKEEEDSLLHKTFTQIYSQLQKKDFDLIINEDLFINMHIIAEKVIKSIATELNIIYSSEEFHVLI